MKIEEINRLAALQREVDLDPSSSKASPLKQELAHLCKADFMLVMFAVKCLEGKPHCVMSDKPEMISRYKSLAGIMGASVDEIPGSDGLTRIMLWPPSSSINQRFTLNGDRQIIDSLNRLSLPDDVCFPEGSPKDQSHLRRSALYWSLHELSKKLQPAGAPEHKVCGPAHLIYNVIYPSVLDREGESTVPFDGVQVKIKRSKMGLSSQTPIAKFLDDVEALVRDLYGDVDRPALTVVLDAVEEIVHMYAGMVRNDLYHELMNASAYDGSTKFQRPRADAAAALKRRSRQVLQWPTQFDKYTQAFAKHCDEVL